MGLFLFDAFKCFYSGGVGPFSVRTLHDIKSSRCCLCGSKVYPTELLGNAWIKQNDEYKILCYRCRGLEGKFNSAKLSGEVVLSTAKVAAEIIRSRCHKCNRKIDANSVIQGIRSGGSHVTVHCEECQFWPFPNSTRFSCGECGALNTHRDEGSWEDEKCWSCNLSHKEQWFYNLPCEDETMYLEKECPNCDRENPQKNCSVCKGGGILVASQEIPEWISYLKKKKGYTQKNLAILLDASEDLINDIMAKKAKLTHGQLQKLYVDIEKESS
ncbi:MAG: hypothetical protein V1882_05300 [Candidatus Omnitrophota bacterium]